MANAKPHGKRVAELINAVAERTRVRWDDEVQSAADEEERRLIDQLRVVDQIAGAAAMRADAVAADAHTTLGATPPRPTERLLAPGRIVGQRYRIQSFLGKGGMGEVWQAFDLKLRVDVALKAVLPDLLANERAMERLRLEVRAARDVVSPNVCRIFDLEEIDGHELVSMEYVDGRTLLALLRSHGPLDLRQATEIATQLLAGLEAIHQANLIHCDIKPENIMITRSGRVVLMDFGLVKPQSEDPSLSIVGTPAYMAPEQALGQGVDPRADIYAAGIVLAEMLGSSGSKESRMRIHEGAHASPPRLPDSAWRSILLRAVAADRRERYSSARALARELEQVTLRVDGAEERRPYPGLSSFTAEDADYFFGREQEIEALWKKLGQGQLLGVIGPSGAGKSSLLRAGLIPTAPEGWRAVVCTPGSRPFASLAQAFAGEFAGEPEAVHDLLRFDEPEVALRTCRRWRERHPEALLIVDQFEELFTLNSAEGQKRFASLLVRLAHEADLHVLLSMRDDFLFHCHEHEALSPVFSDLTAVGPPTGSALRRAVVQPALLCGYRFEDEDLVKDLLDEVARERGALPLVAFTVARLWEERDREAGLLTREAYEQIGGVGGALARHAEATVERIGGERLPVVREIFRNLITARGTRAAREVDELLSVFEPSEREAARQVLPMLVDSRLLTSYEVAGKGGEEKEHVRRVEIIHESLLNAWPRLVGWRTQDADGARQRDQLRQAAQLWQDRDRSHDLLWSGTAFREFELWRERYPGGLTATEQAFAEAMEIHARTRRRRRRIALTGAFGLLVVVLGVFIWLWQQSETAKRQAILETQRAAAAGLHSLAELELDRYPTAAVAYALASLELHDDPQVRRLALEALWRGPTAIQFGEVAGDATYSDGVFTADGNWLVGAGGIYSAAGGSPVEIPLRDSFPDVFQLGGWGSPVPGPPPDGMLSFPWAGDDPRMVLWSVSDPKKFREMKVGHTLMAYVVDRGRRLLTLEDRRDRYVLRDWPVDGGEPRVLGELEIPVLGMSPHFTRNADVHPDGHSIAYAVDHELYLSPVEGLGTVPARSIGRNSEPILNVAFDPSGERVASTSRSGEIRVWTLEGDDASLLRLLQGRPDGLDHEFSPDGSLLARTLIDGLVEVWDLTAPPDAAPLDLLRLGQAGQTNRVTFHSNGRWAATMDTERGFIWPLARVYPRILRGHTGGIWGLIFTPDGNAVISSSADQTVRRWRLSPTAENGDVLYRSETEWDHTSSLGIDSGGRYVLGGFASRIVRVIPLDGGPPREFVLNQDLRFYPNVDPRGRYAAWAEGGVVRVLDVESSEIHDLGESPPGWYWTESMEDGRLMVAYDGELWAWDPESKELDLLIEKKPGSSVSIFDVGHDDRQVLTHGAGEVLVSHDLATGESRKLESHGDKVGTFALDPTGGIAVTGGQDGVVRVGPVTGEAPHLLLGHEGRVSYVAVSPDGRWIASGGADGTIRLWPMPEGTPFHTLPYEEFLDRLRAVADPESLGGYRIEAAEFPGWETVPTW